MDVTASYAARASKLRGAGAKARHDESERQKMIKSKGLSYAAYWKEYVRCKADVIEFYQIFYPEYPPQLVDAIARRIEEVVVKARSGQELDEREKKMFTQKESEYWDYKADIQQQELAGKIQQAMDRLNLIDK